MSALNATSRAECVCNWGDDCLRFREHFNKILETDGQCLFAGTYRPNLTAGPEQANFFDRSLAAMHCLYICCTKDLTFIPPLS